jgi:hypothetical protein
MEETVTLQHIVLFSFPTDLSVADDRAMRDQVASWATEIATMGRLRFGTDLTRARTGGYQYLLYTEFEDEKTLQAYRDHPVHQQFLAWITERSCTPLAFDYFLDATTVLKPEPEFPTKEQP